MSVSTHGSQPTQRSSWSQRLLGAFAIATLSLLLTQGFSPAPAHGDHTGSAETSIEVDLGVGLAGVSASASDASVCQEEEDECKEGKKCRGKLQCHWSLCKDCFKKNPLDIKGKCHKFPPGP